MFCLCSLLILTITLTSLTHPARPRRPLWFPGRMRNAQARHVMTSGSGDSGDVSSKTPRERNIWNEWKLHGNYMETTWKRCETLAKWSSHATTITWYVVIRCDGLSLATSNALTCLDTSTCSRPAEPPVKLWQNMTSKQHPRRQPGGTFGVTFGVGRPISQANGCQLYPIILEACFKGTTWSLIDSHWHKDIQRLHLAQDCLTVPSLQGSQFLIRNLVEIVATSMMRENCSRMALLHCAETGMAQAWRGILYNL